MEINNNVQKHISKDCVSNELPRRGPWQRNRLQLYVGLLRAGGAAASVVWIPKYKTSLDWKVTEKWEQGEKSVCFN